MKILVIEDEQALADTLRRAISSDGHWVDVAHDGHRGLELALTGAYDAIVLDLMLPGPSGDEVCRRLRKLDDHTLVLMLTAKDGEYDEADGLDAGADDYLTKPFSLIILLARLRALGRRAGRERPTTLQVGDLTLDIAARLCKRDERTVELTAREAAVLGRLMAAAGGTVSKQDILDEVWDSPADLDPNIVEVYVSSLRKKIDAPFGRHTLRTVRGAGYRLAPDEP
ncbi:MULTISPECIES: response regulator transcription factor [Streptomyces]|uniref:response regulator transcription factor n=1 Tax=Streptomyces TaxID=1883 RepID=UPI00069B9955|nr:response regulator transcription factor [Streptomyces kasugaensis]MYU55472.1 response regulator [Streptomyces sp. SID7805]WSK10888.1 response regulator transcription factor [Streptomyces celluloflavus]